MEEHAIAAQATITPSAINEKGLKYNWTFNLEIDIIDTKRSAVCTYSQSRSIYIKAIHLLPSIRFQRSSAGRIYSPGSTPNSCNADLACCRPCSVLALLCAALLLISPLSLFLPSWILAENPRFVPPDNISSIPLLPTTGRHILRSILWAATVFRAGDLLLLDYVVELIFKHVPGVLFGAVGDVGVIQRAVQKISTRPDRMRGGGRGVRFEASFLPGRIWGLGTRHFSRFLDLYLRSKSQLIPVFCFVLFLLIVSNSKGKWMPGPKRAV